MKLSKKIDLCFLTHETQVDTKIPSSFRLWQLIIIFILSPHSSTQHSHKYSYVATIEMKFLPGTIF